ncbi:MAG: type VI secretion system baseplate subunit TssK [Syntrophaceae bacterium]
MDIQRPLFWHQGLFLQPQHFQLLDLSFRSLLTPFYNYIVPHFWGAIDVEIQKAALGTRTFSLLKGGFLFPDGTYVVLPGNALINARSFEEAWVEGGKPFTVFIGMKKLSTTSENVTVLERLDSVANITTRFVAPADADEVKDIHMNGPSGQVKSLYHVLRIFYETEKDQLGDYVLIPVAQLERAGEEIVLSQNFIPPCMSLSSSGILLKIIKEIRDQISARGRQLEEYKSQRGIQTAEFGSRDMVYMLALRSLNRYIPMLFQFTETPQVHPWMVFGLLRQLIGELSAFSENINALGDAKDGSRSLPFYNHRNIYECFSSAQSLISQLLDEITAGPDYVIRLVYDGTYYTAELKPAVFEGRNRYYIVLKTEDDPKAILDSISTAAKLSSREQLPLLIARALPGIGLEHLAIPPQELPRRANSIYFAVDHHNDQWTLVSRVNNIALYWDNAPDDLEVELMVVSRK